MEQLAAVLGIDVRLLIIQGINFALLLIILSYFLYKPVLKIIDERREKVAEGVRIAESASRRLAEAKVESEELVGEAGKEAEGLVASARTRANQEGQQIVKNAEAHASAVLKDASDRADEAKRQALKESEREIARAAMLAAEKLLRKPS